VARSRIAAARLDAVAAAKRVHRLQSRVTEGEGLVDVFEVIAELDVPLVFKPLNSALGLCLPAPLRGIIVTTRRGLHIQRFTAAHELGHVVLNHRGSVDRVILERGPLVPTDGRDLQEVAADAFAAEFLLPRWLYRHHVQSQGWTVAGHLRNPDIVYQLSLRLGASYEATCWGLVSHQILPHGEVNELLKAQVARLKASLGEEFKPANSWADVWRLTGKDNGARLSVTPMILSGLNSRRPPAAAINGRSTRSARQVTKSCLINPRFRTIRFCTARPACARSSDVPPQAGSAGLRCARPSLGIPEHPMIRRFQSRCLCEVLRQAAFRAPNAVAWDCNLDCRTC
jgi:Zn-dependent peptidase ImmA (M78 family)